MKTYIYGKHAVHEALLRKPSAIDRVWLAPQISDSDLRDLIRRNNISITKFVENELPREVDTEAVHQGIIASVLLDELVTSYKEFAQRLEATTDISLVLLGEVQDPHNVGAIIRSAAAFGISGILIPEHNQAPVTGTVVKVSAGTAFSVPLITIGNVNSAIRDLKDRGFWIYGLEGQGSENINDAKFDVPAVFILGNESSGIREKTRELCDFLLSIPMNPRAESLNVAASAAVVFHAWSIQHPIALKLDF